MSRSRTHLSRSVVPTRFWLQPWTSIGEIESRRPARTVNQHEQSRWSPACEFAVRADEELAHDPRRGPEDQPRDDASDRSAEGDDEVRRPNTCADCSDAPV